MPDNMGQLQEQRKESHVQPYQKRTTATGVNMIGE